MRGILWTAGAMTIVCSLAEAATPDGIYHLADTRSMNTKRQVIDCMNKQMGANRTLSYNDATRLCKEMANQLAAQQSAAVNSPGSGQAVDTSAAPLKAVSAP